MKLFTKCVFVLFVSILFILSGCVESTRHSDSLGTVDRIASNFPQPPVEYGMTFYWGWDGNVTPEVIARDFDDFSSRNVKVVTLEPGYGMAHPYLSEGWFEDVKTAVELAKQRGMRVWLVDEGKYPSGFAGGKFSQERPDLRMQALIVEKRIDVESGKSVSRELSPDTVGAIAVNKNDSANILIDVDPGRLEWTAPEGDWEVLIIEHQFRSSNTRAVNNPTRKKDTSNSLCDYLNPEATKQFIEFTHAEYKKYVGSEFGKTIMGFRGDEPDYSIRGIPYTPAIFDEFQKRKGYDVKPYVAAFFAPKMTDEQKRVKADYWDVWSDLFSENFFKVQADWCAENNLQYLVHLNREDDMPGLVHHEGDFFKDMRYVQMPGVDAIWNQIWPGNLTDFPKYASSAAHVMGKPRAFTESFAAYRTEPDIKQAKWVLDHQFVRGINMVEVMFVPASSDGQTGLSGWLLDEQFPTIAQYINRASYILSQGTPAAKIAVYYPTTSMWLGDDDSNDSALGITKGLLAKQLDFDFIDEYALCSVLEQQGDSLVNLSGQSYSAVIVPSVTVMSRTAINNLKQFAQAGGTVIFLGSVPTMVTDGTFRDADRCDDLSWAITSPDGELTKKIISKLPAPDVSFDEYCPDVKYLHRKLADGADLYFFFNESIYSGYSCKAKLQGNGKVLVWDAMTGQIVPASKVWNYEDHQVLQLELQPYESKFIVIGTMP